MKSCADDVSKSNKYLAYIAWGCDIMKSEVCILEREWFGGRVHRHRVYKVIQDSVSRLVSAILL